MKILKIDLTDPDREAVKESAEVIRCGGLVIFPTDTVYGVAASALDEAAIGKLFELKRRPENKPLSIIVPDLAAARRYAAISKKVEAVLSKILPGPFTVILRKKDNLPKNLTGGGDTVGVRIPRCRFTELLSQELKTPYTATSANVSGQPATGKIEEVKRTFAAGKILPDIIIDAGDLPEALPSTIVDLTGQKPKILRTGPISREKLLEIIKSLS